MRTKLLTFLMLAGGVGCATAQLPTEKLVSTEGGIQSAEQLGAAKIPEASLYLQYAKEQVAAASALIKDGKSERAAVVLERADADAQLAVALAKEAPLRSAAQQALEQVKSMKGGVQ